jgi:hypothetical protein
MPTAGDSQSGIPFRSACIGFPPCRSCGLPLLEEHVVARSARAISTGPLRGRRGLHLDFFCPCGDRQRVLWELIPTPRDNGAPPVEAARVEDLRNEDGTTGDCGACRHPFGRPVFVTPPRTLRSGPNAGAIAGNRLYVCEECGRNSVLTYYVESAE